MSVPFLPGASTALKLRLAYIVKQLYSSSLKALSGHLSSALVSGVILPDVGHYPPLEAPERFERIMTAYIEAATPVAAKGRQATGRIPLP